MRSLKKTFAVITAIICLSVFQYAFAGSFSDVTEGSDPYIAVEILKKAGIIQGYSDGTFRPDSLVNRAEALKLAEKGAGIVVGTGLFNTGFPDVPLDSWYAGYVMQGLVNGIVKGNPDGNFYANRPVNKAEYLKMILKSFNIDLSKHQNLTTSISLDTKPGEWFIPYLSYAKSVGLIYPDWSYHLNPGQNLTRGDCAIILYKMYLIKYGGNAQKMLNMSEARLIDGLIRIYLGDVDGAISISDEAVYYSGIAVQENPESTTAQATKLLSQAFQKLFQAYKDIETGDKQGAKNLVQQAQALADQAVATNSSSKYFADSIDQHAAVILQKAGS